MELFFINNYKFEESSNGEYSRVYINLQTDVKWAYKFEDFYSKEKEYHTKNSFSGNDG